MSIAIGFAYLVSNVSTVYWAHSKVGVGLKL